MTLKLIQIYAFVHEMPKYYAKNWKKFEIYANVKLRLHFIYKYEQEPTICYWKLN